MKFNPDKHGVRSTTKFRRGTVQVPDGGKDLTAEEISTLGPEAVDNLVQVGFAVLTEDGKQVFPEPPAEAPAEPEKEPGSGKAAGGTGKAAK